MSYPEKMWTRSFVLASMSNFLHSTALALFLHLPGLLENWGEGRVTIGLVVASMSLGAVLVRPFVGRAMDLRGRRRVILIGGVGHVLACAGYFTISDVGPWLWVVRIVHGVSEGALFASLFTTAADLVPVSRRTEGLALFGVSGLLPMALGGLLGDAILVQGSYRDLFAIAWLLALMGAMASLALPETRIASDESSERPSRGFLAVATQSDLVPIWIAGVAFASALGSTFAFMKSFVLEERVGSIGIFYAAYGIAAIVLRIALGWVPDRVGPKRVLAPALFSITIALALLASAHGPIAIGISGALAGLGGGYAFPILTGLTTGRARIEERGSALSLFTAIFDVGMLISGPLFGNIAHATSLRTMFAIASLVPLAGLVFFFAWEARIQSSHALPDPRA